MMAKNRVLSLRVDDVFMEALDAKVAESGMKQSDYLIKILTEHLGTDALSTVDSTVNESIQNTVDKVVNARLQDVLGRLEALENSRSVSSSEAVEPAKKPLSLLRRAA
jgi:antitoxin component of RelBE/YafQ-DinJ toxin-antitoxin module